MAEQSTAAGENRPLSGFLTTNATLVAWLIFLGFGSAFLAFYYSKIHYFPELKWEESFSYLAAISVLGGGIVAIYGLLLFVPGWIWSEFLIFDAQLEQGTLCYHSMQPGNRPEPCFWSISHFLVVPFALLMVVLHLAIFAGDIRLLAATTVVGILAVTWYSLWEFLKEINKRPLQTSAKKRSLLVKYVVTADVAALASVTSLFILSHLVDPRRHSWGLLVLCTIWVVVSNFLVAVQYRQRRDRAVMTSIIAALTLIICGETFSERRASQSERLMASFGVGDPLRQVSLELTDKGAALLKNGGLQAQGVTLLSRLGEEYLVEGTLANGTRTGRVALPKRLVNSWSSIEPEPQSFEPPFIFSKLKPARKVAYVLDCLLLFLTFLWVGKSVRKERVELTKAFSEGGSSAKAAEADPPGPCEGQVYVEVSKMLYVETGSGDRAPGISHGLGGSPAGGREAPL